MSKIFEFENKHTTQLQIDGERSRGHAEKYADKMMEAFAVLNEVQQLLSGHPVIRENDSQCTFETAEIPGQDFRVKLLFACDIDKPIAAEIIRDGEE